MKNLNLSAKSLFATVACAAVLAGPLALAAAPATALAKNYDYKPEAAAQDVHHEGDKVTIGHDWGTPVYAEWHRGNSGKWWATFWTYNGTYVYATPAVAGCGWNFYCYDNDGDFIQIVRCEESKDYNVYGKKGISSHWQELDGERWF